ncbi:SPFH domain / Band 7 family protein [Botrimarina colliarenosi]|uniref:SPFH domain / Band 7 family protein n=1 Tax=Botrimarina colliarenosi TaxID=2528001 RepID=A0A5C6ALJ4_9BACT|nr:SPFH domain-containing protein [Botrimarina colliarenosi]TWU00129.1 SPFH domain / Band 7 family protein [Botrimarina colliarenosi]
MVTEKPLQPMSGWFPLLCCLAMPPLAVAICIGVATLDSDPVTLLFVPVALGLLVATVITAIGFKAVAPNDSRALLLFGEYQGTIKESGFYWVNPFYSTKKVSLRVRNFETGSTNQPEKKDAAGNIVQHKSQSGGRPSKVNDRDGNPVEISAVVVWKVIDTAEALFEVDDYEHYVAVQSEAALRGLASRHQYDSEDHETSLRGSTTEVSDQLEKDIQERLGKAGVQVIEARISHLAYAPEIAAAMLQRQQAQAVVAARTQIVAGAVGMVRMALDQLSEEKIVELDDERRAAMVSNLLVVLCSDKHTQPVVNTGTLYN